MSLDIELTLYAITFVSFLLYFYYATSGSSTNSSSGSTSSGGSSGLYNSEHKTNSIKIERLSTNLSAGEGKIDKILEEFLKTEENYVEGLQDLQNYYIQPIKESNVISIEKFQSIFNEIEIIIGVNQNFLLELQNIYKDFNLLQFANLLLHFGHSFKLYTAYIGNYETLLQTLQEEKLNNTNFKSLIQNLEENLRNEKVNDRRDLSLAGFLILPLQRIPRYQLLLTELLSKLDKTHLAYETLQKAKELIIEIAFELNSRQLEYTMLFKYLELVQTFQLKDFFLPNRKLLFVFEREKEIVYKRTNGKRGVLDMYIFSDLVLLNRRSGFLPKQEFLFAQHSMDVDNLTNQMSLVEDFVSGGNDDEYILQLIVEFKEENRNNASILENEQSSSGDNNLFTGIINSLFGKSGNVNNEEKKEEGEKERVLEMYFKDKEMGRQVFNALDTMIHYSPRKSLSNFKK
ncbi:hypothetical protein ABK040_001551 [Willaertia magna]